MFKALLALSLAMLACCAAAAWAGPVVPLPAAPDAARGSTAHPFMLPPAYLAEDPSPSADDSLLGSVLAGRVTSTPAGMPPRVTLSSTPFSPASADAFPAETTALPDPAVRSAVIPLPSPLYAALALLGLAFFARRAAVRLN